MGFEVRHGKVLEIYFSVYDVEALEGGVVADFKSLIVEFQLKTISAIELLPLSLRTLPELPGPIKATDISQ